MTTDQFPELKNGIQLHQGEFRALLVGGAVLNRQAALLSEGNQAEIYAPPKSVKSVYSYTFKKSWWLKSVRLNEGLEQLWRLCFERTGIK